MIATVICTHDGPVLVTNPAGTASFPTLDAAEAEVRRLKGLSGRPEGAALTITKHQQIHTGETA